MGWVVNATPWPLYPPGLNLYPLYRSLIWPLGPSGRVRKFSPPLGSDPHTVHPETSRNTNYRIPAHSAWCPEKWFTDNLLLRFIAQVLRGQLLAMETRVHSQDSKSEICGRNITVGQNFFLVNSIFHFQLSFHQCFVFMHLSHRGMESGFVNVTVVQGQRLNNKQKLNTNISASVTCQK